MRRVPTLLFLLAASCTQSNNGNDAGPPNAVVHLDAPPTGQGFQFKTESTPVPAGQELQDCYFFQIPGTGMDPVFVKKIELAQTDGSHHMNIFRVKTIVGLDPANGVIQRAANGTGECFKSPNWADWPLVINTQQDGNVAWELPEGVAHKFIPGEWVMLQTHYVNATTQATPSEGLVFANFWTTPASAVTAELGTLFATKQSIRVCQSDSHPKFHGSCGFNSAEPLTIIGANGHFHSRGRAFEMFNWDGTSITEPPVSDRFYVSDAWDDPPMSRSPELVRTVPAHGGVYYTCSYDWVEPPASVGCEGLNAADKAKGTADADLDCCYTFGGVVERSEHCNIFVYYYPKVDDINCF